MAKFVIDIDPNIVKNLLPAIRQLKDEDATKIFLKAFGDSGLPSSAFSFKENMIQWCNNSEGEKLEIGPFDTPQLSGPNVEYFDILGEEDLRQRAVEHNRRPEGVPTIHHVDANGDLSSIGKKFDLIFSSHCIEHAPDLVSHLKQVADLLRPTGAYFLVIPDKRYCFDQKLPESTIADVIQAHHSSNLRPSLDKIIEHRALLSHNDALRHWLGDHRHTNDPSTTDTLVANAIEEFFESEKYIDVHCWQFTPTSLLDVLRPLVKLNLFPFSRVSVSLTPFGRKDFTAVFHR